MSISASTLRVLTVEDDEDFAKMLEMLLRQRFAAGTVIAGDCSTARKAFLTDFFHLITLDFELPDGNGLELLEEITASGEHPPVIMVTGEGDEETASRALMLGAHGYVVKDHRMHALLGGAVEKALESEKYRKALLHSERQYRELVELANSIILKMDGEGNLIFINRCGLEFFGYTMDEIIGRNVVGTIVPEVESTGRGLSAMIRDIVSEPDSHHSNFNENMLRDGKRVWILWGNRSIRDEDGNVIGTLSIGNDVTELQRSTANLEHLTSLYSLMISIIRKLTHAGDPQVLFNEVCRAVVESGLFKMAWIGLLDEETGDVVPGGWAGDDGYLDRTLSDLNASRRLGPGAAGIVARDQRCHICNDILHDGRMEPWWEEAVRRGYCSSAVFPLFSNSRTLGSLNLYAGTPGFFNDVTVDLLESLAWEISFAIESFEHQKERDLAIEALRENEERYHGFYEHSPLEYQSLDENGCLITVNSAWLELMGYEPEEVVGRWFGEFLTPEDVERFKRKFREFTAEGKVHTRFEMIRKDRTRRCVWLDGQVWYDDDGFVKQANCILHEETGPESRAG